MDKHSTDNKGFTLLELLVAAAILAIIIIPLLSAFLTSTRVTATAKTKERATTAGSNVMEILKADGIENVLSKDGAIDNGDGTYTYATVQTIDGKDFTVEALLDPTAKTSDTTDEAADYNQKELAQLYSMSATYDAFYQQDSELDTEMADELKNNNGRSNDIFNNMQREIDVNITKTGNTTTVYVQCNYWITTSFGKQEASSTNQCIYTNARDGVNLRNIYLFYNPMYTSDFAKNDIKETINIENNSLLPVNVYLIQQNIQADQQDAYGMNVICLEKGRKTTDYLSDGSLQSLTTIRSNLDASHMNVYYGTTKGSYSASKTIDGTQYSAKDLLDLTGLEAAKSSDRVYYVTINVYEDKGDNKGDESLITLTTTMQKK